MRRFGKKSVFWKWIVSYIVVVIVLGACNVVTNTRNLEMMKEHRLEMNEVVKQQVAERVYDNMVQLERLRERIMMNAYYHSLSKASASQYKFLGYYRYALYSDIVDYQAVNDRFSKILVYFEDGDYIISSDSVNSAELYYQVFQNEIGLGYEEWRELLANEYNHLHIQKTSVDGEEGLIYARTLQFERAGWQRVNIYFVYTADDVKELLVSHTSQDATSAAIKGRGGQVILCDKGELISNEADAAILEEAVVQELGSVTLSDGEELLLSYEKGGYGGTICLISSENIYMASLRQSQKIYAVTFAVTILLSLVLIVLFARNNYKPLKQLMDVLEPDEWVTAKTYKNEYAMVQEKVSKVQNENKHVNLTLRRQNKLFRGEYLAKLLTGNKVNIPENQLEEFYDISYISDIFAVMLFYVESYEEDREEEVDLNKAQFILGNIFEEVLEDLSCKVYQTTVSDLMVLVVNLPEKAEEDADILQNALERGMEFVDKYFNMGYSVTISKTHEGRGELPVAYQEALQAMECKRLYGLDDMVYYKDIIELTSMGYYYPLEIEQDFIRQIQASNFEAAKAVYEGVVEKNMNGENVATQDALRCLMYDLLGTVLKTLDEKKEDGDFVRELKPAKRMTECQGGVTQMQEVFEEILRKTCEYMNVKAGSEDNETICEQIKEYIKKNYYDPNLSVTSIAEHFALPPVMMSKMFRETVGEKIPVVVSEVRLEAAKKLMRQSEESLGEIAEKAGFGSVRTFTRIFKQIENCTPGQWRDANS